MQVGSSHMRRMRSRATRGPGSHRLVAIVLLAGTLLLLVEGFYVYGVVAVAVTLVVTWLTGSWVVPRSVDAYQRRVTRKLRDWRTTIDHAWDRGVAERAKIAARVARLDAPPRLTDDHRRVVDLLARSDRLRTDRSLTFAERARGAAEARQELRALGAQLTEVASERDERRFGDALVKALAERDDVYRSVRREVEAATERTLAGLARVRAPAEWSEQHAELARRLGRYLDAIRRQHALIDAASPAEAEAGAAEFERVQADLFDFMRDKTREFVAYWDGSGAPGPEAIDAQHR